MENFLTTGHEVVLPVRDGQHKGYNFTSLHILSPQKTREGVCCKTSTPLWKEYALQLGCKKNKELWQVRPTQSTQSWEGTQVSQVYQKNLSDFPDSPTVRTPCAQHGGHRSDPWSGNQDPAFYMPWPKREQKSLSSPDFLLFFIRAYMPGSLLSPLKTQEPRTLFPFRRKACESESRSVVSDSLWTQARILEWVAFPFSRGSSQPGDWIQVSHIAGGFFTSWATGEIIMENNSKQGSQYGHTSYLEASTGFWQSREAASSW